MSNESSWYKQREEFNDLVNLWDQAIASGIFDSADKEQKATTDFFGQSLAEDPGINNQDTSYWNDVVARSGEIFPDENMMLMEAAKKKANENKKAKTKKKVKDPSKLNADGGKPLNDLVKTTFEKEKKLTNAGKVDVVGNQPQKVAPDTVGPDASDKSGRVRVTAGLAAHPNLERLEELKKKLYQLETEMSDKDGLSDKRIRSLEKKFQDMFTQIEKLSNELHGKYSDNEYYN